MPKEISNEKVKQIYEIEISKKAREAIAKANCGAEIIKLREDIVHLSEKIEQLSKLVRPSSYSC